MSQNLKFIHLASGADAQHSDANVGAIIFEPKTGRIAVDGTSGLEYYGGNIKNATFADQILTLSFNKGNDIKLDFSDTASASGVNAIMKAHADRIKALEDVVGNSESGLVKDVAANTAAINANKASIDLINHETNGILAQAKGYTDTEIKKLKDNHDALLQGLRNDVNSNDTDIAALQALHAKDGETMKSVKDEIDAKVGTIDGTVKNYVDTEVGKVNTAAGTLGGRVTTLEGKVSGLEETVNNTETGLVKKVANNAAAITALEGRADALESKVGDENSGLVKGVADNKAAIDLINHETTGILAQAKSYTDTEIGKVNTAADTLKGRVESLENVVGDNSKGLVKKINTLIGEDADKSVRAISAEEVAKVVASAPEDFDTLKEIADWIANDKTGSAQMANDIATLKTTVGNDDSGLVKKVNDNATAISGNANAIDALEALHAKDGETMKSVATEVSEGIAAIPEASDFDGTDVKVTVKTAAGSVSDVIVDASILAGKVSDNTKAITDETARAKKAEGDLSTTITGIRSDLGTKTADEGDAFTRIKALEDAQTSGSLMWSVWD